MKKTTKAAQMPPSITLRLPRGRSVKITWRPRQRVSSLLVKLLTKALAVFLPLSMGYAQAADVNALPTGGQVTAGSATINQTGNTLNINQASQKAALNWQTFNIGTNGTVNFVQPNSNAVALNRIGGNSASEIYGHLNANGQVFLMNPNGILFGRGSQVNVGGIVATTMQLGDADFLAGNYNFSNAGVGSVANYGLINATNSVAFLGGDVSNQGSIFATTASLVSGNTVALDVSTDGLIRARVVDAAVQANIANSGDINATQVTLSAGQAKDTLNRVVNNSGVIKATGFSSLNGEITLQGGTTLNSGTLDATSATGNGGTVHMLGQHVGVVDSGSIDVSGATGGGTILVGGDYQGKNTSIENAEVTYVGAQTTLKADATQNGNGGKVIVWADDTTRAYGSISAQGGVLGGDGGFVETSGHRYLDVNGARVNTLASQGATGSWLLDPLSLTIVGSTGALSNWSFDGTNYFPTFATSSSVINDSLINLSLATTSVTISTTNSTTIGGGSVDDIIFDSDVNGPILINTTAQVSLTLNADKNIKFKGSNGTTFHANGSTAQLDVYLNSFNGDVTTDTISKVTLSDTSALGKTKVHLYDNKTWDNKGVLDINGHAAVGLGAGSTLNNTGTINFTSINSSDVPIFDDSAHTALFKNAGIVNWSGASSATTNNIILGDIQNSGTFNLTVGKLIFDRNSSLSGTYDISTGTFFTISSTAQLSIDPGGARFIGSGTLQVDGDLDLDLNPLTVAGLYIQNGTLDSSIASSTSFGSLSAGTVNIGSGSILSVDLLNGYIPAGGQSFVIARSTNTASGTFSTTNIPANSTFSYTISPNEAKLTFASSTTTSNSNDSSSTDTDETDSVIAALTNENSAFSSEDNIQNNLDEINQTKQEDDEIKAPEKVLVALNFVDDPNANKDNPIETEKPKGRTLQCSVNK